MQRGIIEKIEQTSGGEDDARGVWVRIAMVIDGVKYSTFNAHHNVFKPRDKVVFEFKETEKDGKIYRNLINIEPDIGQEIKNEVIPEKKVNGNYENDRQNSIERQCALKTAVTWCNAQDEKMDVLTAADTFVKWIQKK